MYKNGGLHNYNDFSYNELVNAILDLAMSFNVNPKDCVLHHIEFGVNLVTGFHPIDFMGNLIQHKGEPFCQMRDGIGKSCRHSQYTLKIYDKGLQNHLSYNVLRVEIKVNAMDYLHSKGIPVYTLADLMDLNNLKLLGKNLLDRFNEILFYDNTIKTEDLSTDKQIILGNARLPEHWDDLKGKNGRAMFRRKYLVTFAANANIDWKQNVSLLIQDKLSELLVDKQ